MDWNLLWYEVFWFCENVLVFFEDKMYCRVWYFVGKDLYFINVINLSMLFLF